MAGVAIGMEEHGIAAASGQLAEQADAFLRQRRIEAGPPLPPPGTGPDPRRGHVPARAVAGGPA
jgi:hypothetical protein